VFGEFSVDISCPLLNSSCLLLHTRDFVRISVLNFAALRLCGDGRSCFPQAMGCAASASPDVMAERNLTATLEIMFDAYGKPTEQVGWVCVRLWGWGQCGCANDDRNVGVQVGYTDGHYCITPDDKATATLSCSSLLYGEVLPAGITKLLSSDYLGACRAQVLFDLGMGVGKFVLQAFLQYPNLKYVCGVELAASRYHIAEQALLRMASLQVSRPCRLCVASLCVFCMAERLGASVDVANSLRKNVFWFLWFTRVVSVLPCTSRSCCR
jgi:hypothetical protein